MHIANGMNKPITCDIFCAVIDNFGDIGVCWRLAKQLVHEHEDDSAIMGRWSVKLSQTAPGNLSRYANTALFWRGNQALEFNFFGASIFKVEPAQLVIEAFACELPERYVAAMVAQEYKSVWINLEYLSAEEWGLTIIVYPRPILFYPH